MFKIFISLVCIVVIAFSIFHIGFILGIKIDEDTTLPSLANWGTFMAGITGIIGIVLLYETYKTQKQELKQTHQALNLQKIDSAFYNMLSLIHQIVNSMEFSPPELDIRVNALGEIEPPKQLRGA